MNSYTQVYECPISLLTIRLEKKARNNKFMYEEPILIYLQAV